MTILERKVFISSNPRIVLSSCPPPCGHFSIQESATGGLSYKAKKAAHIGGASGHHGPKLHKLVAVQIIEIQQVSFFVRVGAVHFVHRVFVLRL